MSFNCRGLANPLKTPALKRVVCAEHPDIIMLHETLGISEDVKLWLEKSLPGWQFQALDVRGRSKGLAIGWNIRNIKPMNVWGMESMMGLSFSTRESKDIFTILNVYIPYLYRRPFWEKLFSNPIMRESLLILGGDLNFTLGHAEVWGPHAQVDPLSDVFTHHLADNNLLDIVLEHIHSTWRNKRSREHWVAKRLDHFLISESLTDRQFLIRQWVGSGGMSDHFPIFMELKSGLLHPACPLKFIKTWLEDESFIDLFKVHWSPFDPLLPYTATFQFAENMKRMKSRIKE